MPAISRPFAATSWSDARQCVCTADVRPVYRPRCACSNRSSAPTMRPCERGRCGPANALEGLAMERIRTAIYFTPAAAHPLTEAAARWLGRDAHAGPVAEGPPLGELDPAAWAWLTAAPCMSLRLSMISPFRKPKRGRTSTALWLTRNGSGSFAQLRVMTVKTCMDSPSSTPASISWEPRRWLRRFKPS